MIMMLYRCVSAPGTGFGADYFSTGRFTSSSGKNFKMRNFGGVLSNFAPQGVPPGHSAPSPIVPAGKLNTTSTVLSSGEALKKTNFVWVLSNSRVSSRSLLPGLFFPVSSSRSLLPGLFFPVSSSRSVGRFKIGPEVALGKIVNARQVLLRGARDWPLPKGSIRTRLLKTILFQGKICLRMGGSSWP